MTAPVYVFLPFLRRGASAAIDHAIDGRGGATVSLTLDQQAVDIPITMPGPADVAGLDRSLVRRFVPPPAARAAEPYLFASIEFSLPDLPWMFTPLAPQDGRLQPWLVLVVVRAEASAIVSAPRGLPRLELSNAAGELPDLDEAWAWAHVQVIGDLDRPVAAIAGDQPQRLAARLVCPRKLEPGTAWRACVVPAFAAGRAAGLGEPAPAQPLDPAWPANVTGPVSLPVYLSWEFSTASDADFETLARRLVPCELPDTVGNLPIDAGAPGGGVRGVAGDLALAGALGASEPPALPPAAANTAEDLARVVETAPPDPLVVSPPQYGAHEIDVDPRWRSVAGLGAAAVRDDQEQLVAASWEQLGEAREANRLLGWIRVARHVAVGIHRKHLSRMSGEALATISSPAHARMRLDAHDPSTLRVTLRAQLQVPSVTAPEVRRALRPAGSVFRNRALPVRGAVTHLTAPAPNGLVTPARVLGALGNPPALAGMKFGQWTDAAIAATPRRDQFYIVDENGDAGFHLPVPPLLGTHSPDDQAFRTAARASLAAIQQAHVLATRPRWTRVVEGVDRSKLLAALDPAPAFQQIVDQRIATPEPHDTLDPITGAPVFTRPAYLSVPQAYLLPGLEHVPMNSTSVVVPNPRFAQAFLAGMNHELRRELLWREFPCAHDAVFFSSFWGQEGALTVLLIRGDLVRRFPGLAISSVPAVNGVPDLTAGHELAPLFRGGLEPDALFAAFALTRAQARERFFVLQAPPSAPRFGLDAASTIPVASLTQRNDLAWTHMPAGTHASIAGPLVQRVLFDGLEQATWGRTAADQAWLTLQLPVRLVVPGREMVPQ